MYLKVCFVLSMCNVLFGSHSSKEDININPISHNDFKFSDYDGACQTHNEQRRDSLPASSLIHNASTSVVSQRTDRGPVDLPGVNRIVSDDSLGGTTVNVAATIAVKTDNNCCNSKCCDDDKNNTFWCCC